MIRALKGEELHHVKDACRIWGCRAQGRQKGDVIGLHIAGVKTGWFPMTGQQSKRMKIYFSCYFESRRTYFP